jgi:hypothetical protein
VWGISIGKIEGKTKVSGLLDEEEDEDDATAMTAGMTTSGELDSDNELDDNDEDDFAAENAPRPPPDKLMYGGDGECNKTNERRDVTQRPGRSLHVQGQRPELYGEANSQSTTHGQPPDRSASNRNSSGQVQGRAPELQWGATPTGAQTSSASRSDTHGPRPSPPRHWNEFDTATINPADVAAARIRLAEEIMGEAATQPVDIRGLVFPRWRAMDHPAAPLLREYAKLGCPVDVGRDWTVSELEAAVARGPHVSALEDDAIAQIQVEAREKEAQGFAKIYLWEDLKKKLPEALKLSPLAMIPHKSRKYRAILDLSFALRLDGYNLPSVNEATKRCAPEESIDQIGSVLPRIIEALANAPADGGDIMFSKLDIKDGFWRMVCEEGKEWNFAYVLPNHPGEPVEIVVPSALQMGWALSPPFFCAASETARDVAASYVSEAVGTLPKHPLEDWTMPDTTSLPDTSNMNGRQGTAFLQLLEAYVDDFIQLAQTTDPEQLRHCSRAVLHGVHSVFPPPEITGHSGQDPTSLKKLKEGEGLWEVRKDILGWMMDGATRCIELAEKKQKAILLELTTVLRIKRGVPFKRMEKLVGKLRHAAIGIPAGKALFGPVNRLMAMKPKQVVWKRCPEVQQSLQDWRQLIRESAKEPTHVNELVPGPPTYKGTLDASGEGVGGIWVSGTDHIAPIVWRVPWPKEVRDRLVTQDNMSGDITNSDLEMAAEILGWLVLEAVVSTRHAHVGMCSDNSATVAWQTRWASKRSRVANCLLRVLAIRLRKNRASPLVTRHLAGDRNALGDIPSRSYGYKAEWHFENDIDFLAYFNVTFPLPSKNCWTGFQLASGVVSKVMQELLTQGSPMAEWRRLPKLGQKYGKNGVPTADLSECLRTWTAAPSSKLPESLPCSAEESERESVEEPSVLEVFEQASATSTRRSP